MSVETHAQFRWLATIINTLSATASIPPVEVVTVSSGVPKFPHPTILAFLLPHGALRPHSSLPGIISM